MGHQFCSRTVDSERSLLSLGFSCAGLSRALLNLCQSLGLSSKCGPSAISCSARTHALSKMKFVMFTPRCSAPRRMSFASLSLSRMLNLSVRLFRAVARILRHPSVDQPMYVQGTLNMSTCQAFVMQGKTRASGGKPESDQRCLVGAAGSNPRPKHGIGFVALSAGRPKCLDRLGRRFLTVSNN
jgi:hypothetical protein